MSLTYLYVPSLLYSLATNFQILSIVYSLKFILTFSPFPYCTYQSVHLLLFKRLYKQRTIFSLSLPKQATHQDSITALTRDISFQMLFHKIHMEVLGKLIIYIACSIYVCDVIVSIIIDAWRNRYVIMKRLSPWLMLVFLTLVCRWNCANTEFDCNFALFKPCW